MGEEISYSVIVPLYNEEDTVPSLYSGLKQVMDGAREKYEVIFIDDGSKDSTLIKLKELCKADKNMRIIQFDVNRGQGKAMEEGFRNAQGSIIISMDGDMQNDPRDIPSLILGIKQGFDLACGWRYKRGDSFVKRIKSKIGNYLQRKITGLNIHDIGCAMRAYKREIVEGLTFQGRYDHSLLPYVISKTKKIKITEIRIRDNYRKFGETKYGHLSTAIGTIYDYIKLVLLSSKDFGKR